MNYYDLVITRHFGLVEYLKEKGIIDETVAVVSHVSDPSTLDGKNVIGVLPLHLAARCKSVTEIPLRLPESLRGSELTCEQVRQYADPPATYRVYTESDLLEMRCFMLERNEDYPEFQ